MNIKTAKLFLGGVILLFSSCERKAIPSLHPPSYEEMVFVHVVEDPIFPGGRKALLAYLSDNIHYPEEAKKAKVEGRVFVTFVVTKQGLIKGIKVLKGLGYGTEAEAVRVVSKMPRWEPGKHSGKPVDTRYNLPITFQLPD